MLLEATKVTKAFGGLYANSEIDFSIDEGEIVAIIGPNGSGRKAGISENLFRSCSERKALLCKSLFCFSVSVYFTVTFTLTVSDPDFTVIVAVPFLMPLTLPLLVTVAIFLFEEV